MRQEEHELDSMVKAAVTKLEAHSVIDIGLQTFRDRVPENLFFHTVSHAKDVLHEAVLFATHDNLPERDIELLALAAAYHDLGYIRGGREDHEVYGAQMVADAMKSHGAYQESDIETVRRMILDTKLELDEGKELQSVSLKLSEYLLDADLSNFGRPDFFDRYEDCLKECNLSAMEFAKKTLRIMTAHRWLTPAAKKLRGPKKQENLVALERMMDSIASSSA